MDLENVVLYPLVTEKATELEKIGEKTGKRTVKYTVKVHPDANKVQIRKAFKKMYNVVPDDVNVMVFRGKNKRFRNKEIRKAHWKKAIVTFNNGADIDFAKSV